MVLWCGAMVQTRCSVHVLPTRMTFETALAMWMLTFSRARWHTLLPPLLVTRLTFAIIKVVVTTPVRLSPRVRRAFVVTPLALPVMLLVACLTLAVIEVVVAMQIRLSPRVLRALVIARWHTLLPPLLVTRPTFTIIKVVVAMQIRLSPRALRALVI